MSSKFSATRKSQPTPAICKAPPIPIPPPSTWPPDELWAATSSTWHPPGEDLRYVTNLFAIRRAPGTQTWHGVSYPLRPGAEITMVRTPGTNLFTITQTDWQDAIEGDTNTSPPIEVPPSDTFDTRQQIGDGSPEHPAWSCRITS